MHAHAPTDKHTHACMCMQAYIPHFWSNANLFDIILPYLSVYIGPLINQTAMEIF